MEAWTRVRVVEVVRSGQIQRIYLNVELSELLLGMIERDVKGDLKVVYLNNW